jgi:cyanophycin synthetase
LIINEQEAIAAALANASRGDLLLIFGDHISRCWKQIVGYKETVDTGSEGVEVAQNKSFPLPITLPTSQVSLDAAIISDARGVRIARELSD